MVQDFCCAFNSPSRLLLLTLFLFSGLAMPLIRVASNLINAYLSPSNLAGLHGLGGHFHTDEEQSPVSSVVVMGGRETMYNKLRMLPSRRRFRQPTISLTPEEGDESDDDRHGGEWGTIAVGA